MLKMSQPDIQSGGALTSCCINLVPRVKREVPHMQQFTMAPTAPARNLHHSSPAHTGLDGPTAGIAAICLPNHNAASLPASGLNVLVHQHAAISSAVHRRPVARPAKACPPLHHSARGSAYGMAAPPSQPLCTHTQSREGINHVVLWCQQASASPYLL